MCLSWKNLFIKLISDRDCYLYIGVSLVVLFVLMIIIMGSAILHVASSDVDLSLNDVKYIKFKQGYYVLKHTNVKIKHNYQDDVFKVIIIGGKHGQKGR